MLQCNVDVVDATHKPILAQRTDFEGVMRPIRRNQRLVWQIDRYFGTRMLTQLPPQVMNGVFGKGGDENSVLNVMAHDWLKLADKITRLTRRRRSSQDPLTRQ